MTASDSKDAAVTPADSNDSLYLLQYFLVLSSDTSQ
jgi:hypothetical protein